MTVGLVPRASDTLLAHIMEKCKPVSDADDACWRFDGAHSTSRGGGRRPKIRVGGRGSRIMTVARVLLLLSAEAEGIPAEDVEDLEACHKCDNHGCVNPDHLYLGTRQQNMKDLAAMLRRRREQQAQA